MLANLRQAPYPAASLVRYRTLAARYDASCRRLAEARAAAVAALAIRPGDTVFDVACGTGSALPVLARLVGPRGRVVGIDQSPEMAAIAADRIDRAGLADRVRLVVAPVEEAALEERADALLFCYAHDVLQSDRALANLLVAAAGGARVALLGARFLPWPWAAPINLWVAFRARRYLTTYRGLRRPWAKLLPYCDRFEVRGSFHAGTSYLAVGALRSSAASCPPSALAGGRQRSLELPSVAPESQGVR